MKQYTIETPVTYRIEFVNIGVSWYHDTMYYSLRRAINSYFYYLKKYSGERVIRIYAFRGEHRLRNITEDIYEFFNTAVTDLLTNADETNHSSISPKVLFSVMRGDYIE